MLGLSANRQVNLARRDLLRPHLNNPYQSLCNPSTPITSYLFGDDLNKQVDDLTKANKFGQELPWAWSWLQLYSRGKERPFFRLRPGRPTSETDKIKEQVTTAILNQTPFQGGKLKLFSLAWRVLTSDPKIMDIVRHCHIDFWETPRQRQWVAKSEDTFLK